MVASILPITHGQCNAADVLDVFSSSLLDADLGRLLSILKMVLQEDPDASNYGFLPYMATHRGSVDSLLASSYAERVNSAANLILTKGNTLLGEEVINMCTGAAHEPPLPMMEFMRKYHPDATNKRLKMPVTVISEG